MVRGEIADPQFKALIQRGLLIEFLIDTAKICNKTCE